MADFRHLKVGDSVWRRMGADGPLMELKVVHLDDDYIYCDTPEGKLQNAGTGLDDLWKFDRVVGLEEDEELGWGKSFGVTGTYLTDPPKKPN